MLGSNGEVFAYHALLPRLLSLEVGNESRPHVVTCLRSKLAVVCHRQLISTQDLQHEGSQQGKQIKFHQPQGWT